MAPAKAVLSSETLKKEKVLTLAMLRASEFLELSRGELSEVVGISEPTLSRMYQGQSTLSLGTKEGEVAVQLVRIYRSLDSLLGGKAELCAQWLKAFNHHLGAAPLSLIKNIQGLIHVAGYLDAMRAKV